MKNISTILILGKRLLAGLVLIVFSVVFYTSCYDSDDIGGNLYTFKDQNIGEYLNSKPKEFSEFVRLLDTTKIKGLLDGYGEFTCFAPDNEAMKVFYALKGKSKLSDFTLDTLKLIAYDHLIKGDTIYSNRFVSGRLPSLSMSERYFTINYQNDSIYLNKTSPMLEKDVQLHNGVVHKIGQVLNPTRSGIVEVISKDTQFSLFYQALLVTGLVDSLLKDKDESYDQSVIQKYATLVKETGWEKFSVPSLREYGYTILMESDATFSSYGITDLKSLEDYAAQVYNEVYPEDAAISERTNRKNSLNRFVAYHLIDKELSVSKFIDAYDTNHAVKTIDMFEYIETMCPNTLLEVSKIRSSNKTNQLNRIPDTGEAVTFVLDNSDNDATNGVYHEIDGLLVYSSRVHNLLSSKRLRFDSSCFFPELTNNNMRGRPSTTYAQKSNKFIIPRGYIERISSTEQTQIVYLSAFDCYLDYFGDEILLTAQDGKLYDFTLTTLPVPEGNYEVRFGYLTNGKRGMAQFYFDGEPAGLPLNLNNSGDITAIGYEKPGSVAEDISGYQNDKMMRNRGFMKGPLSFTVPDTRWQTGPGRMNLNSLRRILGTYTFSKAGNHTLTVKGLSNGEFMFDFLEFVPTSVLENEDVY